MKAFEHIYSSVSAIPKGKVSTYKAIAQKSGIKNPRLVGFALHRNINPQQIPCHRVVKSDGTLASGYAFGGKSQQKKKLQEEGIEIAENSVDLKKYFYST